MEPANPFDASPAADALVATNAVTTTADRDRLNGEMVEVFGTYLQVASGKAPDAPVDGHAAVRLDDGSLIHLQPPWQATAVRAPEELSRYEGKPVVVKGLLFATCPPPPDGRAYAQVPCLSGAVVVMDRRTYDALQSGQLD